MRSRSARSNGKSATGTKWPVKTKFLLGNVLDVLKKLPENCIHAAVTSPPYWRLRDYGIDGQIGQEALHDCGGWMTGKRCNKCYICHLTLVFRELRRVLRKDGTLWVNISDSYATGTGQQANLNRTYTGSLAHKTARAQHQGTTDKTKTSIDKSMKVRSGRVRFTGKLGQVSSKGRRPVAIQDAGWRTHSGAKLKAGDLCGIPWRLAMSMQADGWYLKSDCIWSKPNPTPESVVNRPAKSHEYFFMFTKSEHPYYDHVAVRQEAVGTGERSDFFDFDYSEGKQQAEENYKRTRNLWTVWNVSKVGTSEAHVAVYNTKLVEIPIMASTSSRGCCPKCGTGWVRRLTRNPVSGLHQAEVVQNKLADANTDQWSGARPWVTKGWHPNCECFGHFEVTTERKHMASGKWHTINKKQYVPDGRQPDPIPAIVMDPFNGSGTTMLTAKYLGRSSVGIDISPEYMTIAKKRVGRTQAPWFHRIEPVG